ncbi:MAG TPA: glycoside hydrolase, partial [candidate division Zixibacteria bacterium]|nr:glycoside hydrolase [candidate division Zixibacteria bacterium]
YPNPFNAHTTIQYSLPKQLLVSIDIFDILGRKIVTLAEGMKPAGEHQAIWDARRQSSGIYFYRIKAGDKFETKKMELIK